ncbi:MAG: alpha/beta fold hydrolase [Erysipelotrichaceae bacterium]|nr:alpha/beta fold hydrolase [Erysipelotrichaceae bacterium]
MTSEKITIGSEYPLNGLLTLPDDLSKPVPAVVFVHGSGSSNMDEKVMALTPFKDLAEGLAKRGVASVRYDKRTYVHAMKMLRIKATVREETIEDAVFAAELLRNDERIDGDNIFIVGHSMGAMLAPRIDAEGGNFKGLIMMAGTPYRLEDIVLRQLKQASLEGNAVMSWIMNNQLKKYTRLFDSLYEMSDETALKKKFGGTLSLYYFKEMGKKPAHQYLLESDKPALILQGEKDFQVLADDDFMMFRKFLAGRENTEFRLYPNLNHLFVESAGGDILHAKKEYGTRRDIPDEVFDDIAQFINKYSN